MVQWRQTHRINQITRHFQGVGSPALFLQDTWNEAERIAKGERMNPVGGDPLKEPVQKVIAAGEIGTPHQLRQPAGINRVTPNSNTVEALKALTEALGIECKPRKTYLSAVERVTIFLVFPIDQ